jgi:predicted CXXCH cytochrome family protein
VPARALGWGLLAALAALTATAAVAWNARRGSAVEAEHRLLEAIPHLGGGDGGYVSSAVCRSCHPDQYASWHRSFHRTMTQVARPETVVAPFDGVTLDSRGRTYELERRGGEMWARMVDPDWERQQRLQGRDVDFHPDPPRTERQVVMTTGSHHMQTYWVPSRFGREVYNLPFVYLFSDRRWVPREDVFLRPPDAGRLVGLWNNSCIECHSTHGQIGFDFEREVFDSATAELGISCEACHGPGQAHVEANRDPWRRYLLHLDLAGEGDPTIVQPARLAHDRSSEVCGQCHGVWLAGDEEAWLEHGHSFRPGEALEASRVLVRPVASRDHPRIRALVRDYPEAIRTRFWSDGMVRVSGREFSGMLESPCYQRGELSCLSCHSMHASDPADQLAAGMDGDPACTQCHTGFREPGRLTAHTRHREASSGSRCMNCHMPHTTYGLMTAMRSHQIDSPSVAASLATGRPNACNLCHLDRSLGWAAEQLTAGWGVPPVELDADQRRVSAALLWLLTGDAGQRALTAWSLGWAPAQEAAGRDWLAPYLGHLLDDPYSVVRWIAHDSLTTLPGFTAFTYDFVAPRQERAQARDAAIRRWLELQTPPLDRSGPAVLLTPRGELMVDELERLGRRRDDTPLFLAE